MLGKRRGVRKSSLAQALVQFLRGLDPSRLIDASWPQDCQAGLFLALAVGGDKANSGWNEVEGGPLGDFADLHNYDPRQSSLKNQCLNPRRRMELHQESRACSKRPA